MKIIIKSLKGVMLTLTAIWGIFFGIVFPLSLILYGKEDNLADDTILNHPVIWIWLINSVICYLGGTMLVMLNKTKLAAAFSVVGIALTITVGAMFAGLFAASNDNPTTILYMPQIFIGIVIILIAIFVNYPLYLEHKQKVDNEQAPSILGNNSDTKNYIANKEKSHKNKKSHGKGKR